MASQINDNIDTTLPAETSGVNNGRVLKSTFTNTLFRLKTAISTAKSEITDIQESLDELSGSVNLSGVQTQIDNKVDKISGKGLSTEDYTTAEKNKLNNIQNNATQNSTDSFLLNRDNHTGTQSIATIDNLSTQLASKAEMVDVMSAIDTVKGGVPVDGDTLNKLNSKISGLQTLLSSDNINLDTVQEIVDAIETIQTSLSTILVNDLTTGGTTKALTAEQGVVLKGLIDSLTDIVSNLTLTTSRISDYTTQTNSLIDNKIEAIPKLPYKIVTTGFALNTGVMNQTINSSTNVETFSQSSKYIKSRVKRVILADIPSGTIIKIRFPLFYQRTLGATSGSNRSIYDAMYENPLYIQAAFETVWQNTDTGLNTNFVLQGRVNGDNFFQYNPSTHTGDPWVDFDVVLDRPIVAGQFIGVKMYVEDTSSVAPYRLPFGKQITKNSTINNFEYTVIPPTVANGTSSNLTARDTIFTETSFTQLSTNSNSQLSFSAIGILAPYSGDVWGISGDSICEGPFDSSGSNGTTFTSNTDARGDIYGNAGWAARYVGTVLKKPNVNISKGSDRASYNSLSVWSGLPTQIPAYPSGTGNIPYGGYLRTRLMEACGVTHILDALGTNDIDSGSSYTTLIANKLSRFNDILSKFNNKPLIYSSFILPKGMSADTSNSTINGRGSPLHQTLGAFNRALVSGNNSVRAQYHRALVSNKTGLPLAGYIDTCSVSENDPVNSDGLWKSLDKTFNYQFTIDGVHPHSIGSDIISKGCVMSDSPIKYMKTLHGCGAVEVGLDLNITTNQQLYINQSVRAFKISRILVWGATTGSSPINLSTSIASIGIYGDATQTKVIAQPQSIAGLTDLNKIVELNLNGANATEQYQSNPYLKLSVAHGSTAQINVAVYIDVLA